MSSFELKEFKEQLDRVEQLLTNLVNRPLEKEYYSTADVAKIMDRAEFTVRECVGLVVFRR